MARFYEPLTARSFLPRRKGGRLRLRQMLLSVPKLLADSRVGSSRKLPGQLRCRQPTRLASAFYTRFCLLGSPFHRESQQSTVQEVARRYATWILRRVYHGLSSDSRPVSIGLSDLSWDSRTRDLKRVVLHTLCVRVVGSAQAALQLHTDLGLWTVAGIDLLLALLKAKKSSFGDQGPAMFTMTVFATAFAASL